MSLLVGTLMAAGAVAQPQPAPAGNSAGDTLIPTAEPQPGPSGNAAAGGMTTKCKFDNGPKAGTTFDFKVMGLEQIPVGVPCQDGAGSTGISVP